MQRKDYLAYRLAGNYDNIFLYSVYNTFSGKECGDINRFIQAFSWKLQEEANEEGMFPAMYAQQIINKIIKELDNRFAIVFFKDKEGKIINIF